MLIPVHEGIHWTALMVDIKQQRLVQFDSMLGRNTAAVEAVRRWVADEAQVGGVGAGGGRCLTPTLQRISCRHLVGRRGVMWPSAEQPQQQQQQAGLVDC